MSAALDLTIDHLDLEITGAAIQEQRVREIAARAMERLGELAGERWAVAEQLSATRSIDRLAVTPVDLDIGRMTDEAAAEAIARAILDATTARLGF